MLKPAYLKFSSSTNPHFLPFMLPVFSFLFVSSFLISHFAFPRFLARSFLNMKTDLSITTWTKKSGQARRHVGMQARENAGRKSALSGSGGWSVRIGRNGCRMNFLKSRNLEYSYGPAHYGRSSSFIAVTTPSQGLSNVHL